MHTVVMLTKLNNVQNLVCASASTKKNPNFHS